jgi:hypothetical protein
MSNHKSSTYPTKYLCQYLVDEDISSHHALHMHGGQTPVPYGCPYLLSWGRRFMVKQQKHKKTLTFYANKSVDGLYLGKYQGNEGPQDTELIPITFLTLTLRYFLVRSI